MIFNYFDYSGNSVKIRYYYEFQNMLIHAMA